jgi:hypothetical protein
MKQTQTTTDRRVCDLCGRDYTGLPSELKGICPGCCQHLGGGKYSCQIMKQTAAAMRKERGR